MSDQIQFDLPRIGKVTMKGQGPWRVIAHSGHSRNIIDANGRDADPFVQSKLRNSANVVFSKAADAAAVVAKANELFAS